MYRLHIGTHNKHENYCQGKYRRCPSQLLVLSEIHANHLEAQNAATRRRNSTFRRKTNTYAKSIAGLQRTLDIHQIIHNYVRPHWTTGKVPAVSLGILAAPLTLENILSIQKSA